ncbi:MAG: hypothetical protein PVJ05_11175 [Candidatus Thorarchaeota archaeon]|jgi:hypothetical protein
MSKLLKGWGEIRKALQFVEGFGHFSRHTLAGIEIFQRPEISTTRVLIRTLEELDSYLAPIFERMQLNLELMFEQPSYDLDVLSEVYGRIVLDYPYDASKSLGKMP